MVELYASLYVAKWMFVCVCVYMLRFSVVVCCLLCVKTNHRALRCRLLCVCCVYALLLKIQNEVHIIFPIMLFVLFVAHVDD